MRHAIVLSLALATAASLRPAMAATPHLPAAAEDTVTLSIDASKPGAKIDRNLFGQFAEHLGTRHLRGRLGRPRFPDSQHPRHPQRRRRRAQGAEGAERALAGRMLRRRIPLAQGHRPAPTRDPQPQLGRRHRAEHLRHARVHGLHRSDRQRGLPLRQHRLGHAAGSRGVAGVPDDRPAHGAGQRARRQRSSRAVQDPLPRNRQRELGLRRQHDGGVLHAADDDLQPLRPQLQPRAARRGKDAEDRRRPRRRRIAVDRVDRDDHEGVVRATSGAGTWTASRSTTTP